PDSSGVPSRRFLMPSSLFPLKRVADAVHVAAQVLELAPHQPPDPLDRIDQHPGLIDVRPPAVLVVAEALLRPQPHRPAQRFVPASTRIQSPAWRGKAPGSRKVSPFDGSFFFQTRTSRCVVRAGRGATLSAPGAGGPVWSAPGVTREGPGLSHR